MTIDQVSPTVWETSPVNWSILASLVYGGSWHGAANRVWADEVCLGLRAGFCCNAVYIVRVPIGPDGSNADGAAVRKLFDGS